jgi:hypothetical protein
MSDYESIHGRRVNYLSSDPTLNSSTEGQVWYNSNSGANKALIQVKAWSSGANTPTQFYYPGGVGGQTDTLGFGGTGPSPQPAHNITIEYGGNTWYAQPNLNTSRRAGYAFGTSTSAVYAAGDYAPGSPTITLQTEEFDGRSWTTGNNISEQGSFGAASGTLTAGLAYGGYNTAQTASSTRTVSYDGTNWTAMPTPGADTNTAGNFTMGGGGTQTAAIFSGGGPYTGVRGSGTETFDGSSWTIVNSMNTSRGAQGLLGTQSDALYAGGRTPARTGATEEWDSSTWTTSSASMASGRNGSMTSKGGGTSGAVIGAGNTGSNTQATEEYNSSINTFTAASWASGNNINTTRRNMAAGGITSAGIIAGGFVPPSSNAVEEYNGTSWTNQNNIPVAKEAGGGGLGVQTAFVVAGGSGPDNISSGYSQSTQEYDGTNWTATGNLNVARLGGGGFSGTEAAGLGFGGYVGASSPYAPPSKTQSTEEYNGSSWSTGNTVPTGPNTYFSASGTQTATVGVRQTANGATVLYDGTNWTAGSGTLTVNTGIGSMAKNGTSTSSVVFGGNAGPARTGATEEYDGTAFSNTATLATARGSIGGSGNTAEAFAAGGFTGTANVNNTEEYTYQGTPAATASTLTSS